MGEPKPRLMVIKGFGGPAATIFCPLFSELADLAVVYERADSSFLDVDPEEEVRAVEAAGDYVAADGPEEVVDRALAYAAENRVDGVFTLSEPLLRQTAE